MVDMKTNNAIRNLLWITRDKLSNNYSSHYIRLWNTRPVLTEGRYMPSGDFGSLASIFKDDFKALFGFLPEPETCEKYGFAFA